MIDPSIVVHKMRFRRRAHPDLELSAVPVTLLSAQLRHRGFDVLPAGVWELLQERVHRAESRPTTGTVPADSSEVRDALQEVGRIAREEFPKAVNEIAQLYAANARLRVDADRSEREASTLAMALLYGDVESTQDED